MERKLADDVLHIEDVNISKSIFKGALKILLSIIQGLEHTYFTHCSGGMASALQVLEIAHTHFWMSERKPISPGSSSGELNVIMATTVASAARGISQAGESTFGHSMVASPMSQTSTLHSNQQSLSTTPTLDANIPSRTGPPLRQSGLDSQPSSVSSEKLPPETSRSSFHFIQTLVKSKLAFEPPH